MSKHAPSPRGIDFSASQPSAYHTLEAMERELARSQARIKAVNKFVQSKDHHYMNRRERREIIRLSAVSSDLQKMIAHARVFQVVNNEKLSD